MYNPIMIGSVILLTIRGLQLMQAHSGGCTRCHPRLSDPRVRGADSVEGEVKFSYQTLDVSIDPTLALFNERDELSHYSPQQSLNVSNDTSRGYLQNGKRGEARLSNVFEAEDILVQSLQPSGEAVRSWRLEVWREGLSVRDARGQKA